MDGVHDLGGLHGFGPVPIEQDEPVYHERWEGRVAAMARHLMGSTTVDRFRYTIEQMPPAEYLSSSYYERWLWAIEHMAADQGLLDGSGRLHPEPGPAGAPTTVPRFFEGQQVRVTNPVTAMHTRVPRYVRNHVGTVVRRAFVWPHPTQSAATGHHGPMGHVYSVAFAANDLFGPDADHTVVVDVWETDLEEVAE